MRGIKCGKSQLRRDEATVGLINWGGMLHIEGRKGASFGTCLKFQAAATKDCGGRARTEDVLGTAQTGRKPKELVTYL